MSENNWYVLYFNSELVWPLLPAAGRSLFFSAMWNLPRYKSTTIALNMEAQLEVLNI